MNFIESEIILLILYENVIKSCSRSSVIYSNLPMLLINKSSCKKDLLYKDLLSRYVYLRNLLFDKIILFHQKFKIKKKTTNEIISLSQNIPNVSYNISLISQFTNIID